MTKGVEGKQGSRGHMFHPPHLRLYRQGKSTVPMVKSRSRMTNAAQSEPGTYANKTDRYSRRFGRRFFSGSSRRLHAIFFIYKGSDRRLRTSPSRGYCWLLGLRGCSRRLAPASKTCPNLSAGLRRWITRAPEGLLASIKTLSTRRLTFGPEGEGRSLGSANLEVTTCRASREAPSVCRR